MVKVCVDEGEGFVELLDHFGDELTIANAARVSYGKEKKVFDGKDEKLLRYLKKHKHMSPFRHVMFRFRLKAPEFVMRQLWKHIVGIETTSSSVTKDSAWNEISGRYKDVKEFYYPKKWRKQSSSSKQGSEGPLPEDAQEALKELFDAAMEVSIKTYKILLDHGVAKEQARMVLPLNQYTTVIWTCSAEALLHFIELRDHSHAQQEIREYAKAMKNIVETSHSFLAKLWFSEEKKIEAKE